MTEARYTAAWVPDDKPERPWDDAADLAVEWMLREARRLEAAPLLVTPTQEPMDLRRGLDPLVSAELRGDDSSRQARWLTAGPVLVYVPDCDTFHLAANYARGAALAVAESISTLSGAGPWRRPR